MRAIRSPGNVNIAPSKPHRTAIQNLTMIFDAGPLEELELEKKKPSVLHELGASAVQLLVEIQLTSMRLRALPNTSMHFR